MNFDLVKGWNSIVNFVNSNAGGIFTIMLWAGVIIFIGAVASWWWKKRKSNGMGGGGGGFPWKVLIIVGVLVAPQLAIPVVLTAFQIIIKVGFAGLQLVVNQFH